MNVHWLDRIVVVNWVKIMVRFGNMVKLVLGNWILVKIRIILAPLWLVWGRALVQVEPS